MKFTPRKIQESANTAEEINKNNPSTTNPENEYKMHHAITVAQDQQHQPSNSTNPSLAISDLVNEPEITTIAPTLDLTSLQTSKHHPDFRIRNQPKLLKLSTILSDLNLHLSAAHRAQNQAAFDAMHARIMKAGEGLESLAQAMPAKKLDGVRRLEGEELCDVNRSMKGSEWCRVEHGGLVEEGEEHDVLSAGRVERAREVYEASLCRGEGEGEAVEDSEWPGDNEWPQDSEWPRDREWPQDRGWPRDREWPQDRGWPQDREWPHDREWPGDYEWPQDSEWQHESHETTLVEGVEAEEMMLLRPATEVALD